MSETERERRKRENEIERDGRRDNQTRAKKNRESERRKHR